uniref:C2H2-type domain-containing protein n=1 Tax=Corethrella appendiculata TaxID=1370023 RepID=U5EUD9_9DIPT
MSFKTEAWYKKHLFKVHSLTEKKIAKLISKLKINNFKADSNHSENSTPMIDDNNKEIDIIEHDNDKTDDKQSMKNGDNNIEHLLSKNKANKKRLLLNDKPKKKYTRKKELKTTLFNENVFKIYKELSEKSKFSISKSNDSGPGPGGKPIKVKPDVPRKLKDTKKIHNGIEFVNVPTTNGGGGGAGSNGNGSDDDDEDEINLVEQENKKKNLIIEIPQDFLQALDETTIIEIAGGDGSDKNLNKFLCGFCKMQFNNRSNVAPHILRTHFKQREKFCPVCGIAFMVQADLSRHIRTHYGLKSFSCQYPGCTYAFVSSSDLFKHAIRHTQKNNPLPRSHVCGICNKDFERAYDLKRHNIRHLMDVDPNYEGCFKCELCDKKFARKDQYRSHTYRHIGYKPYKCKTCDKSFSDASNYAKHLKIHVNDGSTFACFFCNREFKNKMAIAKHMSKCNHRRAEQQQSSLQNEHEIAMQFQQQLQMQQEQLQLQQQQQEQQQLQLQQQSMLIHDSMLDYKYES